MIAAGARASPARTPRWPSSRTASTTRPPRPPRQSSADKVSGREIHAHATRSLRQSFRLIPLCSSMEDRQRPLRTPPRHREAIASDDDDSGRARAPARHPIIIARRKHDEATEAAAAAKVHRGTR
ncbi:hypothetical protein ZWY2020_022436 [Hordeum vulgare]|nr:hypothetical protein ZWY2020_022436 [Hordeum vulgare]